MSLSATARFTPRGDLGRFVDVHVTPAVYASVEAAAKLIQDTAQRYCPVDTGALRDSITSEVQETGRSVVGRVGPHMYYAEYVEFGTWKMSAQPFMRPALEESREPIRELFRSMLSLAVSGA